ncbi:phosphatase PAP2 family protein [Clostridium aminobutyricum]|uniref:Phosphatase PAP2 family protein n=1 Tax=Clostridium aminobutyricum TaxID=33953 RepID=A0A939D8D1_CLOAM|nr:phosphatase PAP2 family protein [Clostridium aminobutyricum]MBN7773364.1 phosphatase PAP2 family protein [Clostridium aminobutyricum]
MNKKRAWIVGGALGCFVITAYFVCHSLSTGQPLAFDTVLREMLIGFRGDLLNPILIGITYLGNSQNIILICIVLLFLASSRRKYGFPLAITACASVTIQTYFKVIVHRPRPELTEFLITQGGYSFPSGHSCTGLVFYGLFAYLVVHNLKDRTAARAIAATFIVLIVLIGISRVYVGVHYPTDVVGGWSLGIVILMGAIEIIERIQNKEKKRSFKARGKGK